MPKGDSVQHRTFSYSLRSPRIAIVVPDLPPWQYFASLALDQAAMTWGGAGFILIPHTDGRVHDSFLRIANKYDPDHVVSIRTFYADLMEVLPDAFCPLMLDGQSLSASQLRSQPNPPFFSLRHEDEVAKDAVRAACSPFRIYSDVVPNGLPVINYLFESPPESARYNLISSTTAIDLPVSSLDQLTSDLSVMKMSKSGYCRGYSSPTVLPEVDESMRVSLIRQLFDLSYTGMQTQLLQWWGAQKWENSKEGLVPIARGFTPEVFYLVVGDSFFDFCLFHDLDRINGSTRWIPNSWLSSSSPYAPVLAEMLSELSFTFIRTGVKTVITTHTGDLSQIVSLMKQNQSGSMHNVSDWSWLNSTEVSQITWKSMSNRSLELVQDFDKDLALPGYSSDDGAIELVHRLPPFVPETPGFDSSSTRTWVVDFHVDEYQVPAGQNFPGDRLQVASGPFHERLRSGRDGVSYMSASFGFVHSGATLRQGLARPKIRVPGLLEWIAFQASREGWKVSISDAGQSTLSSSRIWGDRYSMSNDFFEFGTFFAEFISKNGQRSTDRYPGDGCVLGNEGFLTFKAALRVLQSPKLEASKIRTELDRFSQLGVLRRGLILKCPDCALTQWIKIESLGEISICQRCQGNIPLSKSTWNKPDDEPLWFYDLHPIVRKIMTNNGDVPILTVRKLQSEYPGGVALPELNFTKLGESTIEVDLIFGTSKQIIIGECKTKPGMTTQERNKQLENLATIASVLQVDRVILSAGDNGNWSDAIKSQATTKLSAIVHANGHTPRLETILNVRSPSV